MLLHSVAVLASSWAECWCQSAALTVDPPEERYHYRQACSGSSPDRPVPTLALHQPRRQVQVDHEGRRSGEVYQSTTLCKVPPDPPCVSVSVVMKSFRAL